MKAAKYYQRFKEIWENREQNKKNINLKKTEDKKKKTWKQPLKLINIFREVKCYIHQRPTQGFPNLVG